jgi:hypothetical protein
MKPVQVVGGGLAGSEAAWALANAGVPVVLHEMRPVRMTDAHKTEKFAELVCSNSFRSDDWRGNAVGLLHEEMRRLGSLVMACAAPAQVPAGSALAVDRDVFSDAVTAAIEAHPLISIAREEIKSLDGLLTPSPSGEGAGGGVNTAVKLSRATRAENVQTSRITPSPNPLLSRGALALLIGPEGGFSPEERRMLRGLSYVIPVSLGPRILRAETAVIAALSVIQSAWGDWRDA